MEFFRSRRHEEEDHEAQPGQVIAQHLGDRTLEVTVRRPDGSIYEYGIPRFPLGVEFTVTGPIDHRKTDEDN